MPLYLTKRGMVAKGILRNRVKHRLESSEKIGDPTIRDPPKQPETHAQPKDSFTLAPPPGLPASCCTDTHEESAQQRHPKNETTAKRKQGVSHARVCLT